MKDMLAELLLFSDRLPWGPSAPTQGDQFAYSVASLFQVILSNCFLVSAYYLPRHVLYMSRTLGVPPWGMAPTGSCNPVEFLNLCPRDTETLPTQCSPF